MFSMYCVAAMSTGVSMLTPSSVLCLNDIVRRV